MNNAFILGAVIIFLTAEYVGAQPHYQVDVAEGGDKSFQTETLLSSCGSLSLEIYLADAGAPQNAGGAWLDFTGSTADIAYVSGGRCLTDGSEGCYGPWWNDGGVFINEPAGPGTVMYVVGHLGGASPDGDGDLIIGNLTLESVGCCHDATIAITTIPSVPTWTPIDDADVVPGTLVIHKICGCMTDADCDDGLFCTGVEECDEECCICLSGTPPCNDGDPCTVDNCDGDTQTCNYGECAAASPFDLCCRESVCSGATACYCWGDFDCDEDVDAGDTITFLEDFGRNYYSNPCTNENSCNADFDCDHDVDAEDITEFLEDFGRSQYNNPCPPCITWWCGYPE